MLTASMLRPATVLICNALLFTGIAECLLHLLSSLGSPADALDARSSILGSLVVAPNLLCLVLLGLAEGLPSKRLCLVAAINLWVSYGAAPLFLFAPDSISIHLVWGVLLLVPVGVMLGWVLTLGGRPWLLSGDVPGLRRRRLRTSAALFTAGGVLVFSVTGVYAVVALLSWVQLMTGGFLSFDLVGVNLGDRRYAREDERVRLVGMMHIGEREHYRGLVQSFVEEGTLVLYEGVTDEERLLNEGLDYGGAASALGLEAQHDLRDYLDEIDAVEVEGVSPRDWPVLRHADLDLSAFSPSTREFIGRASALWASESLLEALSDYMAWFRSQDEAVVTADLYSDLIDLRNENLLSEIHAGVESFDRVVVPWGALHLPGLERGLLASDFIELERSDRRLLSWQTLFEPGGADEGH